jgi:glycosyltransferase involved in cell wall biosynthesis
VVGSGPIDQQLRGDVQRSGVSNVSFLGFVNQSRIAEVYGLADVFVMPSEDEPWGLVLNEAMAAGVAPVVCTDVGASADLIREGETGFTFANGDWSAMTALVQRLVGDADARAAIGAAARTISNRYSYGATATGVVDALTSLGVYAAPAAVTTMTPAHDRA